MGAHDLNLILTLTEKLKIKTKIILNRADIASENIVGKVAKEHQSEIIARIPYSKEIEKLYFEGKPIEHEAIQKIIEVIKK